MVSTPRRYSAAFSPDVIAEIQRAADEGLYGIRGFGTLRPPPSFDDLVLLGASVSRYPLEGYRERCATDVTLGTRFAKEPIELKIPIMIAGMSFGALGANAKRALGRGASAVGTSTTTGDGGMSEEERAESDILVYQVLPSRYGFDPAHLRAYEAIEIVVGQGAKPGGGGMLLGHKISERVAEMRTLPAGIDQRSACRHPDWTGPDDLTIKIAECERPPIGKSRSLSRSARRGRVTMSSSRSRPAPTSSCSMACKAAPAQHKRSLSSMPACRPCRLCARRWRRSRNWACTARCSS